LIVRDGAYDGETMRGRQPHDRAPHPPGGADDREADGLHDLPLAAGIDGG